MADIIERLRIESQREPNKPIWRDAIDEIEALRAEVGLRDSIIATRAADTREYQKRISQAEARAERLAEALREELRRWADRKADAIREQVGGLTRGDPGAIARCDAAIQRIDAALRDQGEG